MLQSQTKLTTLNAHIVIGSLAAHSFGVDNVHVLMFAAYRYGLVIYACNIILSQYLNLMNIEKYKLCSQ